MKGRYFILSLYLPAFFCSEIEGSSCKPSCPPKKTIVCNFNRAGRVCPAYPNRCPPVPPCPPCPPYPLIPAACVTVFLANKDFTPSYTITEPGKYVLHEAILYTGTTPGSCALLIDSDDVIVDMNGFSITYVASAANVNGIYIVEDHQNVTIVNTYSQNGAIRKFTGSGIAATTLEHIGIFDISTINNNIGINFDHVTNLIIERTTANINTLGMQLNNIINVNIKDSRAENNTSSGNAIGIFIKNADNVILEHTTAENNTSTGGHAEGMLIESSTGISIIKSIASFNITTAADIAAGIRFISSTQNKVLECTCSSNKAPSAASSFGMYLQNTVFSRFETNTVSSNGYGINDNSVNSTNLYMKNIAFSNSVENYQITYSADSGAGLARQKAFASDLRNLINASPFVNLDIMDTP